MTDLRLVPPAPPAPPEDDDLLGLAHALQVAASLNRAMTVLVDRALEPGPAVKWLLGLELGGEA